MAGTEARVLALNAGRNFIPVDPDAYPDWKDACWSHKEAKILAEFVSPGTKVDTVMRDGHVETTKTAGAEGGYKVTNPDGEQYLIDPKKFKTRYAPTGSEGRYKPRLNPVKAIEVVEDIAFTAPWGEQMRIKAGGWLVKTKDGEVYGIQPDVFATTHRLDPGLMRDFNNANGRKRDKAGQCPGAAPRP